MFYERFYDFCKNAGVTPTHVARELGIRQSTVSMWKKQNSTPRYETLKRIADYFSISVESLLGFSDDDTEALKQIEDSVVKTTNKSREDVRAFLIEEHIAELPHAAYNASVISSDSMVVEQFQTISDQQLKENLLDAYRFLNRRGRIEATFRIDELIENPRFHDRPKLDPPEAPDGPPEAK